MPSRREFLSRSLLGGGSALLGACANSTRGQTGPSGTGGPEEFRAAWIATVHNLDWPSRPGLSESASKGELLRIFDTLQRLNMNAAVLQVRSAGDAIYRSNFEPWSPWLSGSMGTSPGWDPLSFACAEAHRRGLELHAWFNPFRAQASPKYSPNAGHLMRRQPNWVRRMGSNVWFDPSEPGVRQHTLNVIMDVVRRYDVDGVHFDDYFYPYPKKSGGRRTEEFPDDANFRKSGSHDRDAWRRQQVDTFVSSVAPAVHRAKPWVKVGISPFGIWRPGVPAGTTADLDAYADLGADAVGWLKRGWVDYLAPQLYWRDGGPQSFSLLMQWWASQNTRGRHIWPGIDITGERGHSATEIAREVALSRSMAGRSRPGQLFWSARSLVSNRGGVADMLRSQFYQTRASVPASPWLGGR